MIPVWWGHFMWFWGLTSAGEWPYLLWSGAGGDLTRIAVIAALAKGIQQRAKHHSEIKAMHERHHNELMGRDNEPRTRNDDLLVRVDIRSFPRARAVLCFHEFGWHFVRMHVDSRGPE